METFYYQLNRVVLENGRSTSVLLTFVEYINVVLVCYSSVLWTKYGLMKVDTALLFVNSAGALMSISYIIIFYIFTSSRVKVTHLLFRFVTSFFCVCPYCSTYSNHLGEEKALCTPKALQA